MQTKDLASNLKQKATEDVRRKNLVEILYFLTSKENPYCINGAIVDCHKTTLKVHFHGKLVFSYGEGKLRKYICEQEDWAIALINEFDRLKEEQREIKLRDQIQQAKNKAAKESYVIC